MNSRQKLEQQLCASKRSRLEEQAMESIRRGDMDSAKTFMEEADRLASLAGATTPIPTWPVRIVPRECQKPKSEVSQT